MPLTAYPAECGPDSGTTSQPEFPAERPAEASAHPVCMRESGPPSSDRTLTTEANQPPSSPPIRPEMEALLPERWTGIVLAGGQSRRFGTDKARALLHGRPLLIRVLQTLLREVQTVILVVDKAGRYRDLLNLYKNLVPEQRLREVVDEVPDSGPLAGLQVGLTGCETPWALVASCDIPAMEVAVLRLLKRRAIQGTAEAVIPIMAQNRQPLQAAWSTRALPVILEHLRTRRLKMIDLLSKIQVDCLAESDIYDAGGTSRSFVNVNEPSALAPLSASGLDLTPGLDGSGSDSSKRL